MENNFQKQPISCLLFKLCFGWTDDENVTFRGNNLDGKLSLVV